MKEQSTITVTFHGDGRPAHEVACAACVHCGAVIPHKPVRKLIDVVYTADQAAELERQGKTMRGFCMACGGPVCGPGCAACVPVEQYLENLERGLPDDHRPTTVGVSADTRYSRRQR